MIRILLVLSLFIPAVDAQELDKTKPIMSPLNIEPAPQRCYDVEGQAKIDEALELGVQCVVELEKTKEKLAAARKWRDNYKEQVKSKEITALAVEQATDVREIEYRDTKSQMRADTWIKYGAIAASFFTLGVLATKAF